MFAMYFCEVNHSLRGRFCLAVPCFLDSLKLCLVVHSFRFSIPVPDASGAMGSQIMKFCLDAEVGIQYAGLTWDSERSWQEDLPNAPKSPQIAVSNLAIP